MPFVPGHRVQPSGLPRGQFPRRRMAVPTAAFHTSQPLDIWGPQGTTHLTDGETEARRRGQICTRAQGSRGGASLKSRSACSPYKTENYSPLTPTQTSRSLGGRDPVCRRCLGMSARSPSPEAPSQSDGLCQSVCRAHKVRVNFVILSRPGSPTANQVWDTGLPHRRRALMRAVTPGCRQLPQHFQHLPRQ